MTSMQVVTSWTGGRAYALQQSLRMTNQSFAEHLGVSVRSVAGWHQKPGTILEQATQDFLDKALERAPQRAKAHFAVLTGGASSGGCGPDVVSPMASDRALPGQEPDGDDAGCLAEDPGWASDVDRSVSRSPRRSGYRRRRRG